ncbi:tetratricopeptide repeat protein [Roseomonas sp. PWR1]|uniref:Tetratricopeptide repeat protein n=1 Tax=Roseomonas nitratireducens TaxID=2820810 RepID=A0ABS4AQP3_9PROT|nr:tetratricopeptide repeat protein [Neoroseomonas nitratireducens]MBP0463151.1 tetratricopeptide repeat protein [Neoroseomonas nitratireducens]
MTMTEWKAPAAGPAEPDVAMAAAQAMIRAAPADPSAHVALAEALLAAGRPRMAARTFQRALEHDPAHRAARIGLLLVEPWPDAEPLLAALLDEMVLAGAPEPAWLDLIARLDGARRFVAALAAARRGAALHPASIELRMCLARLAFRLGDAAEAGDAFAAVAEAAPALADGWEGLLDALWRQRRFADGLEAAGRAVAAHPDAAGLAARHAQLLLAARKTGPAEREARRALALDAAQEVGHLVLANALVQQQRLRDALEAVRMGAAAVPSSRALATRLAQIALSVGETDLAVEAYAGLVEPGRVVPPNLWLGRADALAAAGRMAEAAETALQGLAQHRGAERLAARCAELLLDGVAPEEAQRALARALGVEAEAPDAVLALAEGHAARGAAAAAMTAAQAALSRGGLTPQGQIRAAGVLLAGGAIEEAAAAYAAASEAAPDLAAAWIGLSDAHRMARRIRPAIEACRRAEAAGADRQALRALRFRLFGEWGD